jgi:hypothetical protein
MGGRGMGCFIPILLSNLKEEGDREEVGNNGGKGKIILEGGGDT